MNELGYKLYLLFTVSWFLHLAARIPVLGAIRFDLLLAALLIVLAYVSRSTAGQDRRNEIERLLLILIVYAFMTFPISRWPGTVIKSGFPMLIKAVVFYYFTVAFITSEKRLKAFLFVYIACQTIRVLEPLYLHVTQGYWGSVASMMGGTEFMMRLSGAPSDTVNPNGLAAVIFSVIPFLYFYSSLSWKHKLAAFVLIPPQIYAMVLTGSRSGLIGLIIILAGIVYKSSRKALLVPLMVVAAVVVFLGLSPDQQDRYLSIVKSDTKHGETAHERVTGIEDNLKLFMKRPIFGFGLGTGQEANYNYGFADLPPHNLFMDVGIQLGIFGIIIFFLFVKAIVTNFFSSYRIIKQRLKEKTFLLKTTEALQILIVVEIIFSFGSYGLLIPSWYFLAGLSIVLISLSNIVPGESEAIKAMPATVIGSGAR